MGGSTWGAFGVAGGSDDLLRCTGGADVRTPGIENEKVLPWKNLSICENPEWRRLQREVQIRLR